MKKYLITHLFLFLISCCTAQLINNKPVDIPTGSINFNAELIQKNRIKSIAIVMVDKPDGNIIIDKGAGKGYEFNEKGNVTRYYYTVLIKTKLEEIEVPAIRKKGRVIRQAQTLTATRYINDTVFMNIYYDNNNRIITKRTKAGDYYDTYYYEYNGPGQIIKEMHCKETNVSENKKEFKLGVQTVLSYESFEYTALTLNQIKKRCLNDEGREYKKAIINYDDYDNKLSESYEFIVSWMRQESTWQYDENRRLVKKTYVSNESGELKEYSVFEYGKNGNLLTESKFRNDILTDDINYLYDETNTFIKSEVNRDHKNSTIGIVKYAYTFF